MGEKTTSTIKLFSTSTVLAFILGYFVYDGIAGALGMSLLSIILGTLMIVCLIPIVGNIFYFWSGNKIITWVLNLTNLQRTWLTTTIYWYEGIVGIIISIIVIVVIIIAILKD